MEVKGGVGAEDILDQIVIPSQKENVPKNVEDHELFHGKISRVLVMLRLGGKKQKKRSTCGKWQTKFHCTVLLKSPKLSKHCFKIVSYEYIF